MTTSESSKAGGQGNGARAITRGEEAAVRAALPQCPALDWYADGRLRGIAGEHHAACLHPSVRATAARAGIVPGPEGWCWAAPLATVAAGDLFRSHHTGNVRRADALETRGLPRPVWRMVKVGDELNVVWESPEDLADPSQWERLGAEGVEGQDKGAAPEESEPAPSTPSPQPEGRPARLRAALLAVLTPGPVHTTAALLPALDAAMGEPAGVAVATGAEARRAAAEIGARVDGVEWSLPAVPDGWGWRPWQGDGLFLAPLDASNVADASIAMAAPEWWEMYNPGPGGEVIDQAPCSNREEGQAAALRAARLAGLFAVARASTADDTAPKGPPAHASDAPCPACARAAALCEERNPLLARLTRGAPDPVDAGRTVATWVYAGPWRLDEETAAPEPAATPLGALARILTGEAAPTMADATAALAAFRADVVATARAGVGDDAAADARHAQRIAENERDAALARAGLDAADRATLDAVGRLREALAALCAGPGQWRWAVDESAPDAAVRLIGVMATAYRDQSHKAADAERALGFARRDLEVARGAIRRVEGERDEALAERTTEVEARMRAEREEESAARERDEALATIATVGAMLDPVLAAIAGGRPVAPPVPSQSCSFCGKSSNETRIFVAGIGADPAVICDECAVLSAQIVEGAREGETVAIAGGREAGK